MHCRFPSKGLRRAGQAARTSSKKKPVKGGGSGEDKGAARAPPATGPTDREGGAACTPAPRASRREPKYREQKREKKSESRREGGSQGGSEEAEIRGS